MNYTHETFNSRTNDTCRNMVSCLGPSSLYLLLHLPHQIHFHYQIAPFPLSLQHSTLLINISSMYRRNEYKILVGKPEGRKPLRRMDPRDIVWEDMKCSLGSLRIVNFLTRWTIICFSRTLFHGVCYVIWCVPHTYHKKNLKHFANTSFQ
jgi:hypothetical protein